MRRTTLHSKLRRRSRLGSERGRRKGLSRSSREERESREGVRGGILVKGHSTDTEYIHVW